MSKLNPAEVSDRFISFVDLIESRAMASGPVTPFLDELASCGVAEKQRFTAILRDLYRIASTKAVVIADTPTPNPNVVLAAKHTGLRVDYSGLLKNARHGLRREPGTVEMLNQLEEHLSELGRRWYDGDATVVDEFLQLYCIHRVRREVLDSSEGRP